LSFIILLWHSSERNKFAVHVVSVYFSSALARALHYQASAMQLRQPLFLAGRNWLV
jgi:hypothetical protein